MTGELAIPASAAPTGLPANERAGALRPVRFLAVALQFLLVVLLVHSFQLESLTFSRVMIGAFAGFLVHQLLPARWRLPFFALLSVAGTVVALAPERNLFGMIPGAVLLATGLALISVCHLPLPFGARVAGVCALGAALMVLRARSEWFPVLTGMWPVLGSMFFLRMMVYLYDLRHRAAEFSPARAVAYFFMLPNVCFPLFPVVDYKTFVRSMVAGRSDRVHQTGIGWMMRGVVQLLLYRVVYHYAPLDIASVENAGGAIGFMVATYLLYLQVSGRFHLIVGLLHMFGFNLPETNHRYYLATSFTDFWRRINIYWKDFIMKLFFYPAFFALRKLGTVRAIALGTLIAFFATWALHVVQWFWLLGVVEFKWQDIAFWTVLGLLVMVNAIREAVAGRQRTLTRRRANLRTHLLTALGTVATFVTICTLWSLWYCGSADELRVLLESLARIDLRHVAILLAGLSLLGLAGVLFGGSTRDSADAGAATDAATSRFWRSALLVTAQAAVLFGLLGAGRMNVAGADRLVAALREDQMNARDVDQQRRGYYEELDQVRANQRVWMQQRSQPPPGWTNTSLMVPRDGFLQRVMAPSMSAMLCGTVATTNRWGMRDREYDRVKPPGTYRFVLLGSSHEVGSGVRDDETFENLVEDRLNRENPGVAERYEILNMAVGGYGTLRKLFRLEYDGFDFAPDAVLFTVCGPDPEFDVEDLATAVGAQQFPAPILEDICRRAAVGRGMSPLVMRHRLRPHLEAVQSWLFRRLADECARRGVRVFAVYRPPTTDPANQEPARRAVVLRRVADAGIELIDLGDAFDDVTNRVELVLAPWDNHTSALGHRLLAERLFSELAPRLSRNGGRIESRDSASGESPSGRRAH